MSESKSALDIALEQLDIEFKETGDIRKTLIKKLSAAVNQMSLDPNNDAPRMQEVKIATIKALDDMLKSAESSAVTSAKVQMQKKNDESSEASRQLVVEMLRNISMRENVPAGSGVVIPVAAAAAAAVTNACKETKHPISEDELSVPEVPLKQVE